MGITKHTLVTDMGPKEARIFFLKHSSYVTFDIPYYLNFDQVLLFVNGSLTGKTLKDVCKTKRGTAKTKWPKNFDKVNYVALTNKDGKYSWRPMQIIHPVLYVDLARHITEPKNWRKIKKVFSNQIRSGVICGSIPMESNDISLSDTASQVSSWWDVIEQESLIMSMEFDYLLSTDISDCYGSIYTHSFEWALGRGGRETVKKNRAIGKNSTGLGHEIDIKIQGINYGQTNGIPQGNQLMNLLAELILSYSDIELIKSLDGINIDRTEYKILRYRDDYRIFVNDISTGHKIMKELNKNLAVLGLKMNPGKTSESSDVIAASIKPEKLEQVYLSPRKQSLQKEILRIYQVAKAHPNTGIVAKFLGEVYDYITDKTDSVNWERVNISVVVAILCQIGVQSPKVISWVIAVVSVLVNHIEDASEKAQIVDMAIKKLKKIPNSGFMELWLQRLSIAIDIYPDYSDLLTKAAVGSVKNTDIWNSDWLIKPVQNVLNMADISKLNYILMNNELAPIVNREEVELFKKEYT